MFYTKIYIFNQTAIFFIFVKMKTISLPDKTSDKEVRMVVAVMLFEKGLYSSGQASDFVGVSKREFLENAVRFGVSIFGETVKDV